MKRTDTIDTMLDVFFTMLRECIESITLPTGQTLVPTFIYSCVIAVASLLCHFCHVLSVIDWRGALLAAVLLSVLAMLERRGKSEVSKLYRTAKSNITAVKSRAEGLSSSIRIKKRADTSEQSEGSVERESQDIAG